MTKLISSLLLATSLTFAGAAFAEDAMAPASGDAMAPAADAMAPADAMAHDAMTPEEMLAACLADANAMTDMAAKDKAVAACNEHAAMAGDAMKTDAMGGDAMGGDAMKTDAMGGDAMGGDAMATDAMKPAQ